MIEVKIIRILKILIGAAGWVWMVIPVVFSGILNIGNGLGMLFFGCLFLWGVFQNKLMEKSTVHKWAKALRGLLIAGYVAFTLFFAFESALIVNAINEDTATATISNHFHFISILIKNPKNNITGNATANFKDKFVLSA